MTMEVVSENKSHGGRQLVCKHASIATGTEMIFSIYLPPQAGAGGKHPVVWYLSGLTCTHANVTEKGEYRAACAEHGLIFVAPDTSPRGEGVPDVEEYDFGKGAGFYVDATQEPWAANYRMWSYVTEELPSLVAAEFPEPFRGRVEERVRDLRVGRFKHSEATDVGTVNRVIFRIVAGGDPADHFASAAREKELSFAVFEKRMLLAIEEFLSLDQERRDPGRIVRVNFPRQFDEGVAVRLRTDLCNFDLCHGSILS